MALPWLQPGENQFIQPSFAPIGYLPIFLETVRCMFKSPQRVVLRKFASKFSLLPLVASRRPSTVFLNSKNPLPALRHPVAALPGMRIDKAPPLPLIKPQRLGCALTDKPRCQFAVPDFVTPAIFAIFRRSLAPAILASPQSIAGILSRDQVQFVQPISARVGGTAI